MELRLLAAQLILDDAERRVLPADLRCLPWSDSLQQDFQVPVYAKGRPAGEQALKLSRRYVEANQLSDQSLPQSGGSPGLYRLKGNYLRFAEHYLQIAILWPLLLTPCSNLFRVRRLCSGPFLAKYPKVGKVHDARIPTLKGFQAQVGFVAT